MRSVYVIGAGMIRFGKYPDFWAEELGEKAAWAAIKDATVGPKQIQAAVCSHSFQGRVAGQRILKRIGLAGIEVVNVENACTGGSTAFRQAYILVAGGIHDLVLAVGVEKMSEGLIQPNFEDLDGMMGRTMPAQYAMRAQRHMSEFGTTLEQLARVSEKNHRYGTLNPFAQYQKACTLEEILNSRMIADPLTLLQCCPAGDGAAAVVLASSRLAKKYSNRPIKVAASVLTSGLPYDAKSSWSSSDASIRAAQEAYKQAGIGPEDIDVCELHDCFSIAEIMHYENLGFCKKGEGGSFVEKGKSEIGGKVAVNPSGGLLSKGHPLGATGIAQVVEIVWQLRGKAGRRQVHEARIGMTHTMGGPIPEIEVGSCAVHIFSG
jgi:benzoylsuccinyl-CoA thiolase BbsB subunit